jgi:RNA polymerase sigma-B factor
MLGRRDPPYLIEDVRLMRLHRRGDGRAREIMIGRYLPLARALASRYGRTAEPFDDLVQVASLGLVKAVDRWDPDRGTAFSSFAVPTILGELRRHFRDATWMVRPPRPLQELSLSVERVRERLNGTTGYEPTATDLAERLGRSPEEVEAALQASEGRTLRSFDTPLHDRDPSVPIEVIGEIERGYDEVEARATIERMTSILDARAREILRLRYEDDLVQSEIAKRMGCSQMQVSRILRSSIERLHLLASAA